MKIEIFKPFGEAYEVMKKILFQPFDLKKWLVLGFAAFLAHLGGGFGFNFNYDRRSDLRHTPFSQYVTDTMSRIPWPLIIFGTAVFLVVVLAIVILFAWLRARGRFIFIDCIVKNRAAIVEPWSEFRKEGNSYFVFALVLGIAFIIIAALLSLPFMLPVVRGVTFLHLHDVYLISTITLWAVAVLLLVFCWALVAHFMVAVMYRKRCQASEALRIILALIWQYPGEITLYCLFWIVLGLATAVVACLITCLTCCVAAVPYVGTVILLPVYLCLRAFSLFFLRQFGPDYDVWAGQPAVTPPVIPHPCGGVIGPNKPEGTQS